jgi:hypothetical protein
MIYDFVIKNQHLTLAQMTQTINRILMIDICENTVKRIMGDDVTRKRGRPKKFG